MNKALKRVFQFINKYLKYLYFFLVISWEPPLPVADTAKAILNEIEQFYAMNKYLPDDISFITDNTLLSDIKQFELSYQKKGNFVYLNVGIPTYTYNANFLDRLTFGLFLSKSGTGTTTRYGREIK